MKHKMRPDGGCVLVRRDKVPDAVVAELEHTPGLSVQLLTRSWPDGRVGEALRLPADVARTFLNGSSAA